MERRIKLVPAIHLVTDRSIVRHEPLTDADEDAFSPFAKAA
jgi:hypothetical protein